MNDETKSLIEEHAFLIARTAELNANVYGENDDDKAEFANKCIQLACMKKYEECLRARLENRGIMYAEGNYVTVLTTVDSVINPEPVFEEPEHNDGEQAQ